MFSLFSLEDRLKSRLGFWSEAVTFVGMERDTVFLLEEELIQLSVNSSRIIPSEKPSLVCSVWTKKTYNTNSIRAQMKSIWKTKKEV